MEPKELKKDYVSNRSLIGKNYTKIETLRKKIDWTKKIREAMSYEAQIQTLESEIREMNKQNKEYEEIIKEWWTD